MQIVEKPYRTEYVGQRNSNIFGICIHIASGNGIIEWANHPNNQGASWHYAVYKDGSIFSFVPDNKFAWANGMYWENGIAKNPRGIVMGIEGLAQIVYDNRPKNPNQYLISVEHQGFTGEPWTEAMYRADAELCIHLAKKYKFPLDRYHVIGHHEIDTIDRRNCPGHGFSFDKLFEYINSIQDEKMYKEKWEKCSKKLKDIQKVSKARLDKLNAANKMIEAMREDNKQDEELIKQLRAEKKALIVMSKSQETVNKSLQSAKTRLEQELKECKESTNKTSKISELIQRIIDFISGNNT